jgi:hypothetical protein
VSEITSGIVRKVAKNKKVQYFIGPNTGNSYTSIDKLDKPEARKDLVEVVIYRSEKAETRQAVNFRIADSLDFSFIPNSYALVVLPMTYKPVVVTYGKDYNKTLELTLSIEENTYLNVTKSKSYAQPEIIQVERRVGEFNSHKAKTKQEKCEGR